VENLTLITAIIGAVSGSIGSVLGVINICHSLSTNRVRLKVIPKIAFMIDRTNVITAQNMTDKTSELLRKGVPYRLCVEVTNLSIFPLTVSDVGFGNVKKQRAIIVAPELSPGKTWPVRLEPRESVTIYARVGEILDPDVLGKSLAYAQTDCGKVKYGTSPIFKSHIDFLKRNTLLRQVVAPEK
jgi:hypothetical protein